MNAKRRKALVALVGEAYDLRDKLDELKGQFEELRDEEEECYDNLPESLQDSERGERMQECIDFIDDLLNELDSAVGSMEYVCETGDDFEF